MYVHTPCLLPVPSVHQILMQYAIFSGLSLLVHLHCPNSVLTPVHPPAPPFAPPQELHSGWDDEFGCFIIDEDKVVDALEEELSAGGCLVDYHGCDFFPERWFDLVIVLQVRQRFLRRCVCVMCCLLIQMIPIRMVSSVSGVVPLPVRLAHIRFVVQSLLCIRKRTNWCVCSTSQRLTYAMLHSLEC